MSKWAGKGRVVLILLVLLVAVVVPFIISGYADAGRAAALQAQDPVEAGKLYRAAALKLPWRPELWENAAAMQVAQHNYPEAISIYQGLARRGVLSRGGWELYGYIVSADTGEWQKAIDVWNAGLKADPAHAKLYDLIYLGYHELGDLPAQRTWLEKWIGTGQAAAEDHYQLGMLLLAEDEPRARAELKQAAAMDPSYGPAVDTLMASLDLAVLKSSAAERLVILARGLGLVNQWQLAEADLQQAVNADRQNAEAWAWLGEARQQQPAQAAEAGKMELDQALLLAPGNVTVHALRGLYWKRQGNYPAAAAEYQHAADSEPGNPQWQAALGEVYSMGGDLVGALAAYQKATELAPTDATYWRLLGNFCADSGVHILDVGLPAAKKAVELAPADAASLDTLGWSYAQAGLLTSAQQALSKAIKLSPDMPLAHLHLAETYLRAGQGQAAREELQRVRELDPQGSAGAVAGQLLAHYFP